MERISANRISGWVVSSFGLDTGYFLVEDHLNYNSGIRLSDTRLSDIRLPDIRLPDIRRSDSSRLSVIRALPSLIYR